MLERIFFSFLLLIAFLINTCLVLMTGCVFIDPTAPLMIKIIIGGAFGLFALAVYVICIYFTIETWRT